jgi:hypothetical protein
MRGRRSLFILLVVGIAAVLFSSTSASGRVRQSTDSNAVIALAGAYTADVSFLGITNDKRLFSFDVVQHGNAGVVGQVEAHNPVTATDNQITVTCLIVHGNQAIVGGTITQSTNPALVGITVAFAVQDDPDQISFISTNLDQSITCDNVLAQNGVSTITDFLALARVAFQRAVVTIGAPEN